MADSAVQKIATRIGKMIAGADDVVVADLTAVQIDLRKSTSSDSAVDRARSTMSSLFDAQHTERVAKVGDFREMGREVPELKRSLGVKVDFVFGGPSEDGRETHGGMRVETADGAAAEVRDLVAETDNNIQTPRLMRAKYREAVQLGDSATELVWANDRLVWVKPLLCERFDVKWDEWGRLTGYAVRASNSTVGGTTPLKPWQALHFAYDKGRGCKYGTSNWETARRIWRAADTLEDVLSILTLLKAGNRKSVAYPVPDSLTPEQLKVWTRELKGANERPTFFDSGGKLRRRLAALLELDDIVYPYRTSAKAPSFHNEPTPEILPLLDLLKFQQERYFVATGVPAALAGVDRNVNARATLEQQGLHFVATTRMDQQEVADNTLFLFYVALLVAGIRPNKGDVIVRMPRVSAFDDMLRAQVQQLRAQTAKVLGIDVGLDMRWVLETVLGVSEEEATELMDAWQMPAFESDPTATAQAARPGEDTLFRVLRQQSALGELAARSRENYQQHGKRIVRTIADLSPEATAAALVR